jgi:hypothetical protein
MKRHLTNTIRNAASPLQYWGRERGLGHRVRPARTFVSPILNHSLKLLQRASAKLSNAIGLDGVGSDFQGRSSTVTVRDVLQGVARRRAGPTPHARWVQACYGAAVYTSHVLTLQWKLRINGIDLIWGRRKFGANTYHTSVVPSGHRL